MELQLDNIKQISEQVLELYRERLEEGNINASGKLSKTAQTIVEFDGRHLLVYLELEDYWKYVEYGRRAGKMPPIDAIAEWIKIKPVIPQPINGKVPDTRQLAFLISRKIGREGIEGRYPIEKITTGSALNDIIKAIKDDIAKQLNEQLNKDLKL